MAVSGGYPLNGSVPPDESIEFGSPVRWEEPVALAKPPASKFPLVALPPWLRDWVVELSAEKGASPDIAGNLALGVVSGALSRLVQVSPRPGWYDEPTNLYLITGLAPGQRKTPIFKNALRPVRTIEQRRIKDHADSARRQALAVKVYEKSERDLLNGVDGEDDPETLLARLGSRPSNPAPAPRLLTEDVTPEGLAGLIGDHGRIIVASDEGTAMFENLAGRYTRGSASWDLFNKGHAGGDLAVDRKGSEPVIVFDPALTIAIVTQPALLRSLSDKPGTEDRGVLARPLYSLPVPVYADGPTPQADPQVIAEYARRVENLLHDVPQLQVDEDGHPRPFRLTFALDARALFENYETKINAERRELGGDEDAGLFLGWVSKLAGHTARLAAVLHAALYWTDGQGAASGVIDIETTRGAILLADYYREHALAAFALMGELPAQRRARTILGWLRTRTAEELAALTVRDVHRSRASGTKADQVRADLALLEGHGWVKVERKDASQDGGRPSERVHVHPSVSGNTPDKTDKTPSEPPEGRGSVSSVRPPKEKSEATSSPRPSCLPTPERAASDAAGAEVHPLFAVPVDAVPWEPVPATAVEEEVAEIARQAIRDYKGGKA